MLAELIFSGRKPISALQEELLLIKFIQVSFIINIFKFIAVKVQ
jgi:hypothetical protein